MRRRATAACLMLPLTMGLAAPHPTEPHPSDQGTPVTGSNATDGAGAPVLTPGRYTDIVPGEKGKAARSYRIRRSPGSSIYVAAHIKGAVGDSPPSEYDNLTITTPAGKRCGEETIWWDDEAPHGFGGVGVDAGDGLRTGSDKTCRSASELVATLNRGGTSQTTTGKDVQVTLQVTEEPGIATYDGLPQTIEEVDATAFQATLGTSKPTRTSDDGDRPVTLTPGTWSTDLPVNRTVFYRMRVDWGQQAALTLQPQGKAEVRITSAVVNPVGMAVDLPSGGTYSPELSVESDGAASTLTAGVPPVRYLNRDGSSDVGAASLPGYYLVALTTEATASDRTTWPSRVPVHLAVEVRGEVTGAPAYIAPATGGAPTTTPEPSILPASPAITVGAGQTTGVEDGPNLLVTGGLAALVLALASAAALVWRRTARPA